MNPEKEVNLDDFYLVVTSAYERQRLEIVSDEPKVRNEMSSPVILYMIENREI